MIMTRCSDSHFDRHELSLMFPAVTSQDAFVNLAKRTSACPDSGVGNESQSTRTSSND